jgi:hypothetical protein
MAMTDEQFIQAISFLIVIALMTSPYWFPPWWNNLPSFIHASAAFVFVIVVIIAIAYNPYSEME